MQTSTSNIEAPSCNLQPTLSSIGNESVTKHLTQKIVKKIRVSITFKVAKGIGSTKSRDFPGRTFKASERDLLQGMYLFFYVYNVTICTIL